MSKKKLKDDFYEERVLYDQYFNVLLATHMLQSAKKQTSSTGLQVDKKFPWSLYAPLDGKGRPKEKDEFTETNYAVHIDVQHFRVGEIDISIKKHDCVIKAIHGPRTDEHGQISRSFTRTFEMPENLDINQVKSVISSDGVLTIHGPYKTKEQESSQQQTTSEGTQNPEVTGTQSPETTLTEGPASEVRPGGSPVTNSPAAASLSAGIKENRKIEQVSPAKSEKGDISGSSAVSISSSESKETAVQEQKPKSPSATSSTSVLSNK